MKEAEG